MYTEKYLKKNQYPMASGTELSEGNSPGFLKNHSMLLIHGAVESLAIMGLGFFLNKKINVEIQSLKDKIEKLENQLEDYQEIFQKYDKALTEMSRKKNPEAPPKSTIETVVLRDAVVSKKSFKKPESGGLKEAGSSKEAGGLKEASSKHPSRENPRGETSGKASRESPDEDEDDKLINEALEEMEK